MNNIFTTQCKIQRKADLPSCKTDGETVLLDTKAGVYLGMNPIASYIWELIETPITLHEIYEQLINEYEVELNQCKQEVLAFLTELQEKKIITVTPA